jgi:hypothetical protein
LTDRLASLPFLWGAATSAHQVEGANDANDWWDWERAPGTPCVEPSLVACDHLTRYGDDIALLADLGLNCYRFSIEWSRVEPREGHYEQRWLAHYRRMLETCVAAGLLPILTFHHFTNPRWVARAGGWENPRTAELFARFVAAAAGALGDLVAVAITINEPNIPALLGYEDGVFPPGKRDRAARMRVTEVFVDAHRRAVAALREARPRLPVGMALAMADWQALPGGERELEELRRLREDVFLDATAGDDFVGGVDVVEGGRAARGGERPAGHVRPVRHVRADDDEVGVADGRGVAAAQLGERRVEVGLAPGGFGMSRFCAYHGMSRSRKVTLSPRAASARERPVVGRVAVAPRRRYREAEDRHAHRDASSASARSTSTARRA